MPKDWNCNRETIWWPFIQIIYQSIIILDVYIHFTDQLYILEFIINQVLYACLSLTFSSLFGIDIWMFSQNAPNNLFPNPILISIILFAFEVQSSSCHNKTLIQKCQLPSMTDIYANVQSCYSELIISVDYVNT